MSIIISRGGKNAKRVERSVIEREDYLQQYIYDNPESLPLHELKDDINILIVSREFPTNSGPIDALGIDRDADIYIIETKLYKNADKRKVIAQVLDYGASLWINESTRFFDALEQYSVKNFVGGFVSKVKDFFGFEEDEVADYITLLEQNVNTGNFKFVVLMDRMDSRLKELISFVNTNSNFDVLGVELDFYQDQDVEIIIPNIYGAERKKEVAPLVGSKNSNRRKWDEISFFEAAEENLGREDVIQIRTIYDWSRRNADNISWGTGLITGSFSVKFAHISQRSVFTVYTDGQLSLNFKWGNDTEQTIIYLKEFGEELRTKTELLLPEDFIVRYVYIPFDKWKNDASEFLQIVEKVLKKD